MPKVKHSLARVAPTFGNPYGRTVYGNRSGYIISCFCGWKKEEGTKAKALNAFEAHRKEAK